MEKLKVAFFVPSFPVVSETFIINQITDLIDKGFEIHIFALSRGPEKILHKNILDYDLLGKTSYPDDKRIPFFRRYLHFLSFLKKNYQNIKRRRVLKKIFNFREFNRKTLNLRYFTKYLWIFKEAPFDVVHAHFGPAGKYVAEMKSLGYFSQTPIVTSFHGYDISPHLFSSYKSSYRDLFREGDLFTVNTLYTYSLLNQLTPKRIEILPVGVNTRNFVKRGEKVKSNLNLLFVGRLVPFKAPGMAVKIMEELLLRGHQDVQLNIVGEGPLFKDLKQYVRINRLDNIINLLGALKQEEIKELMEDSHIFLLPGIYDENGRAENQGLVIQEAQAMELPVVVSDAGGMKYGLIDGETGYVVKEKDINAFVEVVEELLMNESKRELMGRKGRKFVVENYDSALLGAKLEHLYRNLLKSTVIKSD